MHYLRCRNPTEFLKSVDSCMRRVFVKWRNQFRTKVSACVPKSKMQEVPEGGSRRKVDETIPCRGTKDLEVDRMLSCSCQTNS
jgi:hypothetical protein